MRTLIIGGGHPAYFVINAVKESDPGGKITIIEFTKEKAEVLSKTFPYAEVLSMNINGVEDYIRSNSVLLDAVISATESDSLNLRYARTALRNSIPITITVLNNPLNEEIFRKEGIRYIVNPFSHIASKVKEILGTYTVNIIYEFSRRNLLICGLRIQDSQTLNKLLNNLPIEGVASVFVAVDGSIEPDAERLSVGGTLYLMGERDKIKKLLKSVRGRIPHDL